MTKKLVVRFVVTKKLVVDHLPATLVIVIAKKLVIDSPKNWSAIRAILVNSATFYVYEKLKKDFSFSL